MIKRFVITTDNKASWSAKLRHAAHSGHLSWRHRWYN